jgi:hypothetical protein
MFNEIFFANLVCNWQKKEQSELFIISEDLIKIHPRNYYNIDSDDDTIKFVNRLQKIPSGKNVDIILHTSGGCSNNAKMMIDALMNHNGQRRIYIPYKAYSSGTLISLTGHCIYMSKNAHLSPIDTQITINNDDLFNTAIPVNVLSKLSLISKDVHSNLLAIHSKMAKREYYADLKMLDIIFNKLYKHKPVQKTKIISNLLRTKLPHDYPISVTEAREFGLNISSRMPKIMETIEPFFQ